MKRIILVVIILVCSFSVKAQNETVNGSLTIKGPVKLRTGANEGTAGFELSGNGKYVHLAGNGLISRVNNQQDIGISSWRFRNLWLGSNAYVNGKIGIGTTNPSQELDVKGNIALDNYSIISQGGSYVSFGNSGLGNENDDIGINIANDGELELNRNGVSVLTIGDHILLDRTNTRNIGIGTTNPDAKLTVKGNIHTQEVKVDLNGAVAPDYVFKEDYKLKPLDQVQAYIKQNGHLPNIPSAAEMEKEGILLKEMNLKLLEKIEELTLYVLEQQKEIEVERAKNKELEKRLEQLESKFK